MNAKKAIIIAVIILSAFTAYINRYKIFIYVNQAWYTSPLTWKRATIHFDKTNIIFDKDEFILIHSMIRPEISAVSVMDTKNIPMKNAIEDQERDGLIIVNSIVKEKFKGFNSTTYMATKTENGLLAVYKDIPDAGISINFYGKKEDYQFFLPLINAIDIQPNK